MIQSLSHIQRSRRLSQDFDDYLESTSRSSLHSSSSERVCAQYDYEENEAKMKEYHMHHHLHHHHDEQTEPPPQHISKPTPPLPMDATQHVDKTEVRVNVAMPSAALPAHRIIHHHGVAKANQLLQHLNTVQVDLNERDAFSDGNTSFMDELSSDSDLEDDEKRECHHKAAHKLKGKAKANAVSTESTTKIAMVHQLPPPPRLLIHELPKVPKPRNLNVNVYRQRARSQHHPALMLLGRHNLQQAVPQKHSKQSASKPEPVAHDEKHNEAEPVQLLKKLTDQNVSRHERAFSDQSAHSSSMQSSVCTPHRRDDDDDEYARTSPDLFGKQPPRLMYNSDREAATVPLSDFSNASAMSTLLSASTAAMNHVASIHSVNADTLLNIKIFDPRHAAQEVEGDMDDDALPTTETWMNIRRSDTADDVIAAAIHWSEQHGKVKLAGNKVSDYQLRYVDEDEDTLDEEMPIIARNDVIAAKGIDVVGMQFIGHAQHNRLQRAHDIDAIPDVDWDYAEYEVRDEYSSSKRTCILGIGRDRIHIVLKSNHRNVFTAKTSMHSKRHSHSHSKPRPLITDYFTAAASPASPSYSGKRRRSSMTGSLLPHFTYVFKLPSYCKAKPATSTRSLQQHRWIDARVLIVQKNCRIRQHRQEEHVEQHDMIEMEQEAQSLPLHVHNNTQRTRQNAVSASDGGANRARSMAHISLNHELPPFVFEKSIPDNQLLDNMQHIALNPVQSGVPWDENESAAAHSNSNLNLNFNSNRTVTLVEVEEDEKEKKTETQPQPQSASVVSSSRKRRKSSVWSFNLFGLLNKDKENSNKAEKKYAESQEKKEKARYRESNSTEDGMLPNYEMWNTYNKDGKYLDGHDMISPSLRANNRSNSNSVSSLRSSRHRDRAISAASAYTNVSMDTDEFTPLSIELCQTVSVLKRDNTVFEINFLLDLSKASLASKETTPNSMHPQLAMGSPVPDTLYAAHNPAADKAVPAKRNINHNRNPSAQYWGQRTKRKSITNVESTDNAMSYMQIRQHLRGANGSAARSRRQSSTDSIPNLTKQSTVKSQSRTHTHTRSVSNSKEISRERPISQQSSTRSLSIPRSQSHSQKQSKQKHNKALNGACPKGADGDVDTAADSKFQPYQADLVEIWTDSSQCSPSHSASRSSTIELIDAGDYKPSDYEGQWNPTQIIPKLEQICKTQSQSEQHPNSIVKQLAHIHSKRGGKKAKTGNNENAFHVFGNDKYLTHTVRYSAKSPEDCCQIVRKIQHLMLLESKAMDDDKK